jgi:hypothetical protein
MSGSAISTRKSEARTLITYASLRFSGDRLEPARLTEILRSAPTLAYRKGDVYKRFRGHEARGRTGLWLVSSKEHINSADLNDHLEYLLTLVFPENREDRLRELHKMMHDDSIEADVPCFWHGEHGAPPPIIRDDIRERFARIPAEIEEDFDTD